MKKYVTKFGFWLIFLVFLAVSGACAGRSAHSTLGTSRSMSSPAQISPETPITLGQEPVGPSQQVPTSLPSVREEGQASGDPPGSNVATTSEVRETPLRCLRKASISPDCEQLSGPAKPPASQPPPEPLPPQVARAARAPQDGLKPGQQIPDPVSGDDVGGDTAVDPMNLDSWQLTPPLPPPVQPRVHANPLDQRIGPSPRSSLVAQRNAAVTPSVAHVVTPVQPRRDVAVSAASQATPPSPRPAPPPSAPSGQEITKNQGHVPNAPQTAPVPGAHQGSALVPAPPASEDEASEPSAGSDESLPVKPQVQAENTAPSPMQLISLISAFVIFTIFIVICGLILRALMRTRRGSSDPDDNGGTSQDDEPHGSFQGGAPSPGFPQALPVVDSAPESLAALPAASASQEPAAPLPLASATGDGDVPSGSKGPEAKKIPAIEKAIARIGSPISPVDPNNAFDFSTADSDESDQSGKLEQLMREYEADESSGSDQSHGSEGRRPPRRITRDFMVQRAFPDQKWLRNKVNASSVLKQPPDSSSEESAGARSKVVN